MSVIVNDKMSEFSYVFVKGSPEKLTKICLQNSIPKNFENVLNTYTIKGLRVLGMGYKKFLSNDLNKVSREDVESEL